MKRINIVKIKLCFIILIILLAFIVVYKNYFHDNYNIVDEEKDHYELTSEDDKNVVIFDNKEEDIKEEETTEDDGTREVEKRNGYAKYKDSMYYLTSFSEYECEKFLSTIDLLNKFIKSKRLMLLPVPSSSIMIEDKKMSFYYGKKQTQIVDDIEELAKKVSEDNNSNINIINSCDELFSHRDEYLYFNADGHLTSRGGYYVYKAFLDFIGGECRELNEYKEVILNSDFKGLGYNTYVENEGKEPKKDLLYAYISPTPAKKYFYNAKLEVVNIKDPIDENKNTYWSAFNTHVNPYSLIKTNNENNKKILVLKDSFGEVFIPYLVDNYSEIYIVDPRHTYLNPINIFKDIEFDDVLVIVSIYETSVGTTKGSIIKFINEYAIGSLGE